MTVKPAMPGWLKLLLAGMAAGLVIVGIGLLLNRGSQVRLDGSVLKVRTVATDTSASVLVVDLRLKNPARALFWVKEVTVSIVDASGKLVEGQTVAEPDLDRVLTYYPLTGPRYNPTLKVRDKIRRDESCDRTVAAAFAVGEKEVLGRRKLVVRIVDADGVVVEIAEGAGK
ncbi:MAG: hypothetical protein HY821_02895 [Acidobacteria bacterium]|nr:hypothetical protein [Acidobacteriota bacterium]